MQAQFQARFIDGPVLELPATGWVRRYRVRLFGKVAQKDLEELAQGITIAGVKYGPVIADLERSKGMYSWARVELKEGKNFELVMDQAPKSAAADES